MRRIVQVACLAALASLLGPAEAGHELPVYPSYYPQEVRIDVVDPATAAKRLESGDLHAYVGGEPAWSGRIPEFVRTVDSLSAYLVLTFDPSFVRRTDAAARCAAAAALGRTVDERHAPRVVLHPYPITPYHADYLEHVDLVEAARQRAGAAAPRAPALRVRTRGALAEAAFGSRARRGDADVTAEEIAIADLTAPIAAALNGTVEPPWIKAGWFHAVALLAPTVADPAARTAVDATAARLRRGDDRTPEERMNLERELVRSLTAGCERVVVGYAVRRESYTAEYSAGIENIGYDSQRGFDSALFLRTVKLKDFPWNGWLHLGVPSAPAAAWSPIGGFADPAGQLVWRALGDPALLPAPYGEGWIPNRVGDVRREPKS